MIDALIKDTPSGPSVEVRASFFTRLEQLHMNSFPSHIVSGFVTVGGAVFLTKVTFYVNGAEQYTSTKLWRPAVFVGQKQLHSGTHTPLPFVSQGPASCLKAQVVSVLT